jgi:hypothetical protein
MILLKKRTVDETILSVFKAISIEEEFDINGGDCGYGSCDMKGKGCFDTCYAYIDSGGNMHGGSSSSSGCS